MSVESPKVFGALFTECRRVFSRLSEQEMHDLAIGKAKFRVSVEQARARQRNGSAKKIPESPPNFDWLYERMKVARAREEGMTLLAEECAEKAQLLAFAEFIDLPIEKKSGVKRLQQEIVEFIIGSRLRAEVLLGRSLV